MEAATSSAASPTATAVISANGLPPYGAYVMSTVGSGATSPVTYVVDAAVGADFTMQTRRRVGES